LTEVLERQILTIMSAIVRKSIGLALALVMAAARVAVPDAAMAQGQPAGVQVDAVRAEPLAQTAPVIGQIVTRQQGQVAARVAGPVDEVLIAVGDRVTAGTPLARLSQERLVLARQLANAEFETMLGEFAIERAQLQLLQSERDRLDQLRSSAAFSKAQLDDKTNEIKVAQNRIQMVRARLDQTRSHLELAIEDLDDATIRAPYDGVIAERHVAAGDWLRVGDPVVDLINDSALEVEADVPGNLLAGLAPGTEVDLRLGDGTSHRARVRAIVPEENPRTRTRAVRFTVDFGETRQPLAVAQSVTIQAPIGAAREVVTVHKDAVLQRSEGAVVFVVEEGAAAIRPVTLGASVGGRFEVLGGLDSGDLAVTRGNERLRPGQSVTWPGAPATNGAAAEARS
jgi:RND family efflux transporter MFP subunit